MSSADLFARAKVRIPGGVNSPVRAFGAVGGNPVYVRSGKGCRITTEDDRELLDFCGSWGPLILGHAHPKVVEAVRSAALNGLSFGASTAAELHLADLLYSLVPNMEMVRLMNSGTEAAMTALRLARGATGRDGVIKFDGCYHGHSDSFLVAAGSGLLTSGIASSAGVTAATAASTFIAPYNDLAAVRAIFESHPTGIACLAVEPVCGNMGLVQPLPGFLQGLRDLCTEFGALLLFDEVITGFRLAPTTYGQLIGVTPDLTCLGKIIGGGMPIGAVGGSAALMTKLAPLGPVYQAGTLSGNPVAVAAGIATLSALRDEKPYPILERHGAALAGFANAAAKRHGITARCDHLGGMFTLWFQDATPTNLVEVKRCDTARFAVYFRAMLDRGFYLPPSQYEVAFVSAAHSDADIAAAGAAIDSVFAELAAR